MTRLLLFGVAALATLGLFLALWGAPIVDRVANRVLEKPPYEVDPKVQEIFDGLFVVDLHGDPLLWDRDLSERLGHGAIDLPRLIDGNIAVQCFFIVSKTPFTGNIDRTVDGPDAITPLVVLQGWPSRTWTSLLERALYQAAQLRVLARGSNGTLTVLETKEDLRRYRELRQHGDPRVAGILGVEGAHVLEGDISNVAKLHDAGVRVIAPVHFFDNDLGGSAHGERKGGLTKLGRQMIAEMEARGILLDLAHASPQLIREALSVTTKPVVISHTGARSVCDNNRNVSDAALEGVAETGGVIGIGYWEDAVCGTDASAIVRTIRYVSDLVGVDHVALGSDFDGGVPVPFDTTGLALVAAALVRDGFNEAEVRQIMGENAARVLGETLPNQSIRGVTAGPEGRKVVP